MGYIVLDSNAMKLFVDAHDSTEIRDEHGRVIGMFTPAKSPSVERSEPISAKCRAELEERRRDRSGRPLEDVINELRRR